MENKDRVSKTSQGHNLRNYVIGREILSQALWIFESEFLRIKCSIMITKFFRGFCNADLFDRTNISHVSIPQLNILIIISGVADSLPWHFTPPLLVNLHPCKSLLIPKAVYGIVLQMCLIVVTGYDSEFLIRPLIDLIMVNTKLLDSKPMYPVVRGNLKGSI